MSANALPQQVTLQSETDPARAVLATYSQDDEGWFTLLKVEGVNGYQPDMSHLLHQPVPDLVGMQLAVIAAMGDSAGDTLDRTNISSHHYRVWNQHATQAAAALIKKGIDPQTIGDEQACTVENGGLMIYPSARKTPGFSPEI